MFNINKIKFVTLLSVLIQFNIVEASTFIDPTRPPGIISQKQSKGLIKRHNPSWRLSSTLIASERKNATINGRLVRTGELINGATLIDIQSWNVTLQKNNKKFTIYMFKNLQIRKEIMHLE